MLAALRTELANLLIADPWFASIPVIEVKPGDLDAQIDEAIGKVDNVVLVGISGATISKAFRNLKSQTEYYAYFDDIQIYGRVYQRPITDVTGHDAMETAMVIASLWQQYIPVGATENVLATKIAMGHDKDRGLNTWDALAMNRGGVKYDVPLAGSPTISDDGSGNITLDCSTAGAAIFYTLDDTTPAPRRPDPNSSGDSIAGLLYSAPFFIDHGTTVRARAWLASYLTNAEITYTRI